MSGYFLVNWLFLCLGMCAYHEGGVIISPNNAWIIFVGAMAASMDSLSRLANQKFMNTKNDLIEKGKLKKEEKSRSNHLGDNQLAKVIFRILRETNLNGLFLPFLLVASIFSFLDIFVYFYALEYGAMFAGTLFILFKMVIKDNRIADRKEE